MFSVRAIYTSRARVSYTPWLASGSYFESVEAKAKGRYCEKLSCVGLSIQDDPYLPKNDARFVNDMATSHGYILSMRMFGKCYKNGSELLRLWLTCNNRFGERQGLGFPAISRARRNERIRAA